MIFFFDVIIIILIYLTFKKRVDIFSPSCLFFIIFFLNYLTITFKLLNFNFSTYDLYLVTGSYFSAMPQIMEKKFLNAAGVQYFIILLYVWLITYFLSRKVKKTIDFNLSFLDRIYKNQLILSIFLIILICVSAVHLFSMDLSVVWYNNTYLLLENPEKVGIDYFAMKVFHYLVRVMGIPSAALMIHLFFKKDLFNFVLSAILFSYSLILMLAQNSRWASLYFFIMLLYCQISKKGGLHTKILLGFITIVVFIKVIVGRGLYEQGIVSIFSGFSITNFSLIYHYLVGILINVMEGAVGFAHAEKISPAYPNIYKILSFSPFPSFIDGFSSIKEFYEVRISANVPMSSIAESRWFGATYTAIFHSTLILLLIYANKVYHSMKGVIPIFISGIVCWIAFMINSYPIRNVYRIIIITIIVLYVLERTNKTSIKEVKEFT